MRIWREAVGMGCGDGWGVWYGVCVWLAFGIFFPLLRGRGGEEWEWERAVRRSIVSHSSCCRCWLGRIKK